MTLSSVPVLLTSSIVPQDLNVRLKDPEVRLQHAIESISFWLSLRPTPPIVLCDGSGFNFKSIISSTFPDSDIECLSFENDVESVKKYGRGFGEGEIVRYAIANSQKIRDSKCFTKCTSKLWVDNYYDLCSQWNGTLLLQGVFKNSINPFKKCVISYIDTRFYIISVDAYKSFFESAHLSIDKPSKFGLEDVFLERVLLYDIQEALTTVVPTICGVGGAIAKYYRNSFQRRIKDKIRMEFVKNNPRFKKLFVKY